MLISYIHLYRSIQYSPKDRKENLAQKTLIGGNKWLHFDTGESDFNQCQQLSILRVFAAAIIFFHTERLYLRSFVGLFAYCAFHEFTFG